jgi:signal peptidase I
MSSVTPDERTDPGVPPEVEAETTGEPQSLESVGITPPQDGVPVAASAEEPEGGAVTAVEAGEAPEAAAALAPEEEQPRREPARGAIAEWTITILLLLFLTTTLVQAFVIPTGSMEDTLLIGDHLLVDKLTYAPAGPVSKYLLPYSEIKRGDIIVFRYPVDIRQTFVKRCIGVPGDRIRIVNKQVYLNGVKIEEPYKYHKTEYTDSYRDNFPGEPNWSVDHRASNMLLNHVSNGELVVPPDSYFAMGDNRDSSLDSRYWGFVPRENIIGKPLIIYWSYDAPTDQLNNSTISLDHLLDLAQNFFTKTRWRRTFQLIHGYPIQAKP